MTTSRIYIVCDTASQEPPRLVRAISQAHALKHVTKPFTASVATQDELVRWIGDGAEVENAGVDESMQA